MSNRFGNDTSVLTTAPDSLHRIRRGALNPFFSRQRVLGLQDIIRQKLDVLLRKVKEYQDLDAPAPIHRGYMAFSEDIIMQYCFGHDYASLYKQDWTPILHDAFASVSVAGNMALQFPLIPKFMNALPYSWIEKLEPMYALIFRMQKVSVVSASNVNVNLSESDRTSGPKFAISRLPKSPQKPTSQQYYQI